MLGHAKAYRQTYSGLFSIRIHLLIHMMLKPCTSHTVLQSYCYFTTDSQKVSEVDILKQQTEEFLANPYYVRSTFC